MPFVSSGQLTTDVRSVATSETWESDSDWNDAQSINNLEIVDGTVQLLESEAPDSEADDKLAHRWLLTEDTGPFADQVGSANGTNSGTTQVTGDWAGDAAREGDGSSHINVGNLSALSGSSLNTFSIALSFQTTATDVVFGGSAEAGSQALQVGMGSSNESNAGSVGFRIDDSENEQMHYYTPAEFNDGNPHRVVIVKDGNLPSDVSIYVDGSEEDVTNSVDQGGEVWGDWTRDFYLLASESGGSADRQLDGVIDDTCVFDDALTSTEATSYDAPWE